MKTKLTPDKTQGINNPSKNVSPDLFVGHCGYEIVEENKHEVDSSYPSYRLHYVIKGCVTLHFNGQEILLKKNSVFILIPNTGISYKAHSSKKTKTELYWITFNGYRAKHYLKKLGLTEDEPYTQLKDGKIERLFFDNFAPRDYSPSMLNLIFQRNLINIFDLLYQHHLTDIKERGAAGEETHRDQTYMQKMLYYIDKHFASPDLSIKMFAEKFNLHPSTLSRMFKKEMSVCFTEYLTLKRLEYAIPLLEEGRLKVNEVARMVGFEDALYFSRVYKKIFLCSPMDTIRKARNKRAPQT